MMTFVLPSLCISRMISFTSCSVFTIGSGKRLNRRLRDSQVDQNCAAVFLFADKPDAGVTPKPFVVHLQVRHRAARLTPPAIATQDLLPQTLVRRRVQPQAREVFVPSGS